MKNDADNMVYELLLRPGGLAPARSPVVICKDTMKELKLIDYQKELRQIFLQKDCFEYGETFVDNLYDLGNSKQAIYDLFLAFLIEFQEEERVKNNENLYDQLLDFMDGFSSWGANFRLIKNEPDL